MSDTKLPRAIRESTINLLGVDVVVLTLDDGRRIIEADSFHRFFNALTGGDLDIDADGPAAMQTLAAMLKNARSDN